MQSVWRKLVILVLIVGPSACAWRDVADDLTSETRTLVGVVQANTCMIRDATERIPDQIDAVDGSTRAIQKNTSIVDASAMAILQNSSTIRASTAGLAQNTDTVRSSIGSVEANTAELREVATRIEDNSQAMSRVIAGLESVIPHFKSVAELASTLRTSLLSKNGEPAKLQEVAQSLDCLVNNLKTLNVEGGNVHLAMDVGESARSLLGQTLGILLGAVVFLVSVRARRSHVRHLQEAAVRGARADAHGRHDAADPEAGWRGWLPLAVYPLAAALSLCACLATIRWLQA